MTEIILHAGFHKTGSSSIQHSLASYAIENVEYLDWGHVNHSMPFLAAFTNGETAEMKIGVEQPLTQEGRDALSLLKSRLQGTVKPRVILSAESFSVAGYKPGLEQLRDVLREFSERIQVIAYVRPLESLMASDFQQCARAGLRVKMGRSADYLQRIHMLDDVFGRENVRFHVFSPTTLLEGDVVQDFCARIGVDIPAVAVKRVNEGVSLETVAVARCAALFGTVGVGDDLDLELNYFATNQLNALGSTKFRFSSQKIREMTLPYGAELAKVEQRIGGRFPSYGANERGGISSDEDLFDVAASCEPQLIEIVTAFATSGGKAGTIVTQGLNQCAKEPEPHKRVGLLVDTIKNVRRDARMAAKAA